MAALTDQTITIYRGEAIRIPFTMSPVENITGWTLVFTVSKATNRAAKVLGPLALTIDSGVLGTFHRDLTEEQTDLNPATYRWDVWRTDEGSEQIKATGPLELLGNVRVPPIE